MGASQFNIYGTVSLETAQAVEGTKQVRSEIQNLSRSGIAGFEAARQKVIDLTKRIAELRRELLKTSDPAAQARLNAALAQTQKEFTAARGALRGMSLESREANEKVQMLAASLGVNLPMGLERLVARLPAVQAAMGLAFNASIVLAVGAAIVAVIPKLDDWIDRLRGIEAANADVYQKVAELNVALGGFGSVGSVKALRAQLAQVAAQIQQDTKLLEELRTIPAGLPGEGQPSPLFSYINRKDIQLLEEHIKHLQEVYERLGDAIPTAQIEEDRQAKEKAAKASEELAKKEWALSWQYEHRHDALSAALKTYDEYRQAAEDALAVVPPLLADQEAGLKRLPPIIQEIYAKYDILSDAAVAAGKAQIEAGEKVRHQAEELASSIESFIDRVFLTARSVADVFHQFLMQMLGNFVKWVSLMIAKAVLGMKQAQAAASAGGGGGGTLGSLLGILFGINLGGGTGAATVGGATAATTGIEAAFTAAGNTPGAIGVWTGGSMLTAGGGTTATGGIPKAFGGAGGAATTVASLAMLEAAAGIGLTRSALTAGGVGTGAIGGYAISHSVLGAIVGALLGWIGGGRAKRKASALVESFDVQAEEVVKQFEKFKTDYESALETIAAVSAQFQQAEQPYGKAGKRGVETIATKAAEYLARIRDLEKQREARAAIIAGMTVPEFQTGGPVGWNLGGGVLAILHPGEFVMRREAVDRLGAQFLMALNRAPSFAQGGAMGRPQTQPGIGQRIYNLTFNLYQLPHESQQVFQNRIVRAMKRAIADGQW
jgi:hypothetical protein